MTSFSITAENFVNQIEERIRFPHQIFVSHVHPITCVQQLPVIV